MNQKSFTILCAAAGFAVVLAVVAMLGQPRFESTDTQGESLLPTLVQDSERLKTVVIRQFGETLSLDWDGKNWRARERNNFIANSEKVSALLVALARMTKIEGKTKLPDRYARLEVEDATAKNARSRQVSLIDNTGKEIGSVILGKRQYNMGSRGNNTYVRLAGDPQVWLAAGEIEDSQTGVSEWLSKEIIDINPAMVKSVTVTHPNGEKVVVVRETPEAPSLMIQNLPRSAQAANQITADEYARLLTAMNLEEVGSAEDKPFPQDSTIKATIEGLVGFRVELELAEIDGLDWIKIRGTPPGAGANPGEKMVDLGSDWARIMNDLNVRANGWVFQVPAYQVAPLKNRMTDFLNKAAAAKSASAG